jgi:uncharacterized RDD family membrane protein YckC
MDETPRTPEPTQAPAPQDPRPESPPQQAPPAQAPLPAQTAPPPQATPPAQPSYTWSAPTEPSGPAPGFRFAPHGARLLAYIVDIVIVSAVLIVAWMVLGIAGAFAFAADNEFLTATAILILVMLTFIVSIAYFPWFWMKSGQTPGMRAFHLRVVRDRDGGPISGGQAILRLIGYWVSGAVFYLGYIWIFIDSRRRGWHDLIAGTVVVETDT